MADTKQQTDAAAARNALAVMVDALNRCRAENMRTSAVMAALDLLADGASRGIRVMPRVTSPRHRRSAV